MSDFTEFTTGFLPISEYTVYYDNAVNKNLKRKYVNVRE